VKLAAAITVAAVAWAAAVYIHQRSHLSTVVVRTASGSAYFPGYKPAVTRTWRQRPSWEDPVAVLLVVGGVALAGYGRKL